MKCDWCLGDSVYEKYHDEDWGVPVHDDRTLFEMLILEGAQAGLSWITILKRRENYRKAMDNFDVEKISKYTSKKIEELLQDEGIIRNKLKVNSAVQNAKIFIEIQNEFGSFDKYIWNFVNGKSVKNSWRNVKEIPARTELSDKISDDLKKRGMKFVGSVIVYSFLQSVGIINDHIIGCFRYSEC